MGSQSMHALMGMLALKSQAVYSLLRGLFLCFRFSRKILWLELATTNNDPSVVLSYYLRTVFQLEGLLVNFSLCLVCITDDLHVSG